MNHICMPWVLSFLTNVPQRIRAWDRVRSSRSQRSPSQSSTNGISSSNSSNFHTRNVITHCPYVTNKPLFHQCQDIRDVSDSVQLLDPGHLRYSGDHSAIHTLVFFCRWSYVTRLVGLLWHSMKIQEKKGTQVFCLHLKTWTSSQSCANTFHSVSRGCSNCPCQCRIKIIFTFSQNFPQASFQLL